MNFRPYKKYFIGLFALGLISIFLLSVITFFQLKPVPKSFQDVLARGQNVQILDRDGKPLNITYQNKWNLHDVVPLHQIPEFLKTAFVISEDKRFYQHGGVDWAARLSAVKTNISHLRAVRGASTITEQTVRMILPRPRIIWSRWLEGFEAINLEKNFKKEEIFEFYLNQVPYAANRKGVVQAARYYFNRDLDTLSQKEILALVILVRAPSRLDLWKNTKTIERSIKDLAQKLVKAGVLSENQEQVLLSQKFDLERPSLSVMTPEFIRHVQKHPQIDYAGWPHVKTTLDASFQKIFQTLLDQRLDFLKPKKVYNGAVLVVDHQTGEVISWVVGGKGADDTPGRFIDAVTTPRQPGSALKPFLYALALEKGWTASTIIDDKPLTESVGNGLHSYQNYSRNFYGPVTLRQALGNSLNIPALKALQFVGVENYLTHLRDFGFTGLEGHPNFYGDGLALGNGEVTLYELVQAYATIANQGVFQPLQVFSEGLSTEMPRRVISAEVASLLGNILSDAKARRLEFGEYSVLNHAVQTAVKTGTSSDYKDSWSVGYNYRYVVGIWMGNLNQEETDGVTGSVGPALLLRSIFSELNRHKKTQPLILNAKLRPQELCENRSQHDLTKPDCQIYTEWFVPNTGPDTEQKSVKKAKPPIRLRRPAHGLHIAYDPRVPAENQAFEFFIQGIEEDDTVTWNMNGHFFDVLGGKYNWQVKRGEYQVSATVWRKGQKIAGLDEVSFFVK